MEFSLRTITEKLQGRTTMFLVAFFSLGHVLAFLHRLDATYITFLTVFMSFVVGKGYSDDKHEQNMAMIGQMPAPVPGQTLTQPQQEAP
jgi:hypothetical protein